MPMISTYHDTRPLGGVMWVGSIDFAVTSLWEAVAQGCDGGHV